MVFSYLSKSWASIQKALSLTRAKLRNRLKSLFGRKIDEELLETIEEILFEADLGSEIIKEIMQNVRETARKSPDSSLVNLLPLIEQTLLSDMGTLSHEWNLSTNHPHVALVLGANGSGKTTFIAKLTQRCIQSGHSVLLAAGDTFRAAATEQLAIWANRLKVDLIKAAPQSDSAAIAYDAIIAAKARGKDLLLIDTAGRLENRENLLHELEKVERSCKKALPGAPHDVFLVLDATIGQNGIEQAKAFHKTLKITGLILTKLDGTAKGGVVMAIQKKLGIPVQFIGVGEGLDDLVLFEPKAFVHSLLYDDEQV
jgi:fused signal recognition particle receptor